MLEELEPVCRELGAHAALRLFEDADHNLHVPARTGKKDPQLRAELLDTLSAWMAEVRTAK